MTMGLSDIFAAIFSMFRKSAPSVPAEPATSAAPAVAGSPSIPDVPESDPVPIVQQPNDDSAWRALCRPLVQYFESCVLKAYWDALGKVWTCGWGSTGKDVTQETVWTQAQADARLDSGLDDAAAAVDRAVKVQLSPQQKAALVSIFYNVGPGRAAAGKDPGRDGIAVLANGEPSTLLRNLNSLNFASAADQFLAWNKSGGVVSNGLVRRRTAERSLFLTGTWKKS
jgi:lysozyme